MSKTQFDLNLERKAAFDRRHQGRLAKTEHVASRISAWFIVLTSLIGVASLVYLVAAYVS